MEVSPLVEGVNAGEAVDIWYRRRSEVKVAAENHGYDVETPEDFGMVLVDERGQTWEP